MIATTTPSFNKSQPRNCQEERKSSDPELMEIIHFLKEGTLPDDDKRAHMLVLNKPQHTMVEKGLCHIALDKTLQIVLPLGDRMKECMVVCLMGTCVMQRCLFMGHIMC